MKRELEEEDVCLDDIKKHLNPLIFIGTLILSIFIVELTIRYLRPDNIDSSFLIDSIREKSYHLPVEPIKKSIETILSSSTSRYIQNPLLGWSPRPEYESSDKYPYITRMVSELCLLAYRIQNRYHPIP